MKATKDPNTHKYKIKKHFLDRTKNKENNIHFATSANFLITICYFLIIIIATIFVIVDINIIPIIYLYHYSAIIVIIITKSIFAIYLRQTFPKN